MKQTTIDNIELAMDEAFHLGAWYGQAAMEEQMENNSFFDAFLSYSYSEKSGGECRHSVSLSSPDARPIKYNLRSDKWRKAIFGKKDEFISLKNKLIKSLTSLTIKKHGDT